MKKYFLVLCILILASSAFAIDVDLGTVAKARTLTYVQLGLDTNGTSNLPTAAMNGYIGVGIARVNEDLLAYKKNTFIVSTAGTRLYALDSVIEMRACIWYTSTGGDSTRALKYVNLDEADDSVLSVINVSANDIPEYYFRWGDSIGFLPVTANANDSFWVFYYAEIDDTSIGLLPYNYRMGVVFYAAYLAAMDIKIDPTPYLAAYSDFITRKRKGAVEEK